MTTRRSFLLGASALAAAPAFAAPDSRVRIGQLGTEHAHATGKMEALRRLTDLYDVVGVTSKADVKGAVYEGLSVLSEPVFVIDHTTICCDT